MSWQQATIIWKKIPFKKLNISDIWLRKDHQTMEKKDLATLAARNVGEKEKPTNARIALEETNALVVGE